MSFLLCEFWGSSTKGKKGEGGRGLNLCIRTLIVARRLQWDVSMKDV